MPASCRVVALRHRSLPLLSTLFAALLLAGCASLVPEPLTVPEIAATSVADRQAAQKDVEPLAGPLSLEEAIARAIKYNLERRARLMEEAVAAGQFDAGNFDLLPKLAKLAGYCSRNNDLITNSIDSGDRSAVARQPLYFERAQRDDDRSDAVLEPARLRPELLRVQAERRSVADRRRAPAQGAAHSGSGRAHGLLVRIACAQKLRADIAATAGAAEEVLIDARSRSRAPAQPARRAALPAPAARNLRLLETIDQELSTCASNSPRSPTCRWSRTSPSSNPKPGSTRAGRRSPSRRWRNRRSRTTPTCANRSTTRASRGRRRGARCSSCSRG